MHAFYHLFNQQDVTQMKWLRDQRKEFAAFFNDNANSPPSYAKWKEMFGIGLVTFALLIKHFGWTPMYQFMSDYEKDIQAKASNLPKNNLDKIDQWVIRYSKIVE